MCRAIILDGRVVISHHAIA